MDTELAWSPNPKTVDPAAREFTANGKTYRKADSLSAQRWVLLTKLQVEFGYGKTVEEIYANEREAFDLLNKGKQADAAVKLHNNMAGMADIGNERAPVAARLTLLFWNHEGEDVSIMTDELMESKWHDMMQEGIDMTFFFGQALSAVPGLLSAYMDRRSDSSNGSTDASGALQPSDTGTNA